MRGRGEDRRRCPLDGLVIAGGTMKEAGFLRCVVTIDVAGRTYARAWPPRHSRRKKSRRTRPNRPISTRSGKKASMRSPRFRSGTAPDTFAHEGLHGQGECLSCELSHARPGLESLAAADLRNFVRTEAAGKMPGGAQVPRRRREAIFWRPDLAARGVSCSRLAFTASR